MNMNPKEKSPSGSLTKGEIANLTHWRWKNALEARGFSGSAKDELMVIKAAVNEGFIGGPNDGNPREQEVFNTQDRLTELRQRIENGKLIGDGHSMRIPQKIQP